MQNTYWQKQGSQPLYPELVWDKPENKLHAGKLLIIGGNVHSFAVPAAAYQTAENSGIGASKVLLPDALKKTVGNILENGEFAPSTKSGSFAKKALSEWLEFARWCDGVLIPGDLGRNSETAIVLEQFTRKFTGQLTLTQDALDYFTARPNDLLLRKETTLVTSFAQLQKIAINARLAHAFTYDMPVANMVENLHLVSSIYPASIVLKHNNIFYVARDGEVGSTKLPKDQAVWRVNTATRSCVWTLQNPSKIFAALMTAVYEIATQNN